MRKETSPDPKIAGSFRDPSGFLFHHEGLIYRQINHFYRAHYDLLLQSGLYQRLVDAKLLIPHREVEKTQAVSDEAYKVILPEQIPFISYPFEWSFGQLQDAALTTLQIQKIALEYEMSLKDASAYNIQFWRGRPVLIDTLSFEKYRVGEPWVAYRQFCQHFLAPLALMAYRDVRLNQLLRVYVDGIPLDLAHTLLPWCTLLRPSLLMHLHLHAKSQKHFGDKTVRPSAQSFGRTAFLGLIDSLESGVRRLVWEPQGTEWADYYQKTNYVEESAVHKKEVVTRYLEKVRPSMVWDLGANTGFYSRLASAQKIPTVAFDLDTAVVEINYQQCRKQSEEHLLPLILDLTNPSPALGWGNEERMTLAERGPVDLILALALVHHLAISNNLPLGHIASYFSRLTRYLVVEFIPKMDSQVQKLLRTREDIFSRYNRESFEIDFAPYFSILEAVKIRGSERILYLMQSLHDFK